MKEHSRTTAPDDSCFTETVKESPMVESSLSKSAEAYQEPSQTSMMEQAFYYFH